MTNQPAPADLIAPLEATLTRRRLLDSASRLPGQPIEPIPEIRHCPVVITHEFLEEHRRIARELRAQMFRATFIAVGQTVWRGFGLACRTLRSGFDLAPRTRRRET